MAFRFPVLLGSLFDDSTPAAEASASDDGTFEEMRWLLGAEEAPVRGIATQVVGALAGTREGRRKLVEGGGCIENLLQYADDLHTGRFAVKALLQLSQSPVAAAHMLCCPHVARLLDVVEDESKGEADMEWRWNAALIFANMLQFPQIWPVYAYRLGLDAPSGGDAAVRFEVDTRINPVRAAQGILLRTDRTATTTAAISNNNNNTNKNGTGGAGAGAAPPAPPVEPDVADDEADGKGPRRRPPPPPPPAAAAAATTTTTNGNDGTDDAPAASDTLHVEKAAAEDDAGGDAQEALRVQRGFLEPFMLVLLANTLSAPELSQKLVDTATGEALLLEIVGRERFSRRTEETDNGLLRVAAVACVHNLLLCLQSRLAPTTPDTSAESAANAGKDTTPAAEPLAGSSLVSDRTAAALRAFVSAHQAIHASSQADPSSARAANSLAIMDLEQNEYPRLLQALTESLGPVAAQGATATETTA